MNTASSSIIVPDHLQAHFNRAQVGRDGRVTLDTLTATPATKIGVLSLRATPESYIVTRKGEPQFTARAVYATTDHAKLGLAEFVHNL